MTDKLAANLAADKGCEYFAEGEYDSAFVCYSDAALLDPDKGDYEFSAGLALMMQGECEHAMTWFEGAGELEHFTEPELHRNLKRCRSAVRLSDRLTRKGRK